MDINWLSVLIPSITAIIAAILASVVLPLIQKWRSPEEQEKERASAAGVISETSIRMVQRWEARVQQLEMKVEQQEKRIKEQAKQIEELETMIEEQGNRIDELEKENRSLLIENNSLSATVEVFKRGATKLEEQVVDLGCLPVWTH